MMKKKKTLNFKNGPKLTNELNNAFQNLILILTNLTVQIIIKVAIFTTFVFITVRLDLSRKFTSIVVAKNAALKKEVNYSCF